MSADFTPNRDEMKILKPFKFWSITNFPFIADDFDQMTYYELLCKIVEYVKEIAKNENAIINNENKLYQAYIQLQNYVNTYFDNLDLQDEINNKLDQMAMDGTLTSLISSFVEENLSPILNELESNINIEKTARISADNNLQNQINSLGSGSPLVASSTSGMTDTSRVYVNTTDGKWYYYNGSNWIAGGTYLSSFNYYDDDVVKLSTDFSPFLESSEYEKGSLNISNGSVITSSNDRIATTDIQDIEEDSIFWVREGYKMCFHLFTKSGDTYTSACHVGWVQNGDYVFIPKGCGIRASLSDINNTTTISVNDCDKLFFKEIKNNISIPNYYEENYINKLTFFNITQANGNYKLNDTSKRRGFSSSFSIFPYDLKINLKNNAYGFSIYKYNTSFNYIGEISNWTGELDYVIIPKNTYFKIFFRKLDDSDLSDERCMILNNVDELFEIKVDLTHDLLAEQIDIKNFNTNLVGLKSDKGYYIEKIIDFRSDFNQNNLQSVMADFNNKLFLKLDGSTTYYKFNYDGSLNSSDTKPSTSHDNDICYVGGNAYIVGSYYNNSHLKELFLWNISDNTVNSLDVSSIPNNSNGSKRVIGGVCETNLNSGYLYLVCADWYDTSNNHADHQTGDKLSIYKYKISDGSITFVSDYNWDCVYIQGATCVDGILYVACNTQTDNPSNYTGITIKRFNMKTLEELESIIIDGNFEAESLNYMIEKGEPKLIFGVGHSGTMSQMVKMNI